MGSPPELACDMRLGRLWRLWRIEKSIPGSESRGCPEKSSPESDIRGCDDRGCGGSPGCDVRGCDIRGCDVRGSCCPGCQAGVTGGLGKSDRCSA